jgi:hypothetical protein
MDQEILKDSFIMCGVQMLCVINYIYIYITYIILQNADMLQTVWNELDYRVDVYRITNCEHIEHL